jgi:hypothetical protein
VKIYFDQEKLIVTKKRSRSLVHEDSVACRVGEYAAEEDYD